MSEAPGGCCKGNSKESPCCDKVEPPSCAAKGCCSGGDEKPAVVAEQEPCCSSNGGGCCGNESTEEPKQTSCCGGGGVTTVQDDDSPVCLAVIRENGGDIVLFDASGSARSFSFKGDIRKLCFDTHGTTMADDLLTPCFDEDGNHGDPEESCFCGVDTPHLHAHMRDPRTCGGDDSEKPKAKSKLEDNLNYLATQTLHPVKEEGTPLFHINVSERMPAECNSDILRDSGSNKKSTIRNRRRMHKVRHDDHVDYLVHNTETGELHLEHPCNACGQDDVHGKFRSVGKRKLQREGSGSSGGIQLHFFEVAAGPFNVLEFLHDAFEPNSGRVAAVENILEFKPTKKKSDSSKKGADFWGVPQPDVVGPQADRKTVRSTLSCTGICCPAETPMIRSVLEKLKGVTNVMVNVPLKQVIVEHVAAEISATDIEAVLNKNHFGAVIKRDGAMARGATAAVTPSAPTKGRSHFFVQNICCASEIPAINKIVEPIKGVSAVSINVTTKTVYVDHDASLVGAQDICDALNQQGFGAQVRHDFATAMATTQSMFVRSTLTFEHADPDTEVLTLFLRTFDASQLESFVVDVPAKTITVVHNPLGLSAQTIADKLFDMTSIKASVLADGADQHVWNIPTVDEESVVEEDEPMTYPSPAVCLSGVFWVISMLSYIGGNWDYLKYVGLLSVAFGLPAIAIKAFRTLRRYQFDTNCLMLFASVGALALGEFAEAAAVTFLFAISEWLEVRATSRARHALSAIVHLRPEKANLVHPTTHELIVVPASAVPVGAIVSVKTGDKIPCDGVVVEGRSNVDESSLTGESRPIRKGPEDKVSGGTVNSGLTQLMVRTTSTAENSAVSRLIRLVEEAQANRSETEKLVDEFAKIYTPIVVLAALLMCTIPWAFGSDTGRTWVENGLVLIVVACPCALIISTPVSYVAGLAATAQKGILIKGGANLEALGLVKSICFDKTGTLTNGEFALLHMEVFGEDLSRKEVFQYLSLMEERAAHPVAQAVLTGARNEGVAIPKSMKLEKHTIIAGEGVAGVINGLEVHVGNERMFDRLGLLQKLSGSDQKLAESWKAVGGTIGYMSVEGQGIVCAFCAADGVRPESASVVKSLKKQGIELTMLTGDNKDAAYAVGGQIGLAGDEIQAKLLPSDKLDFVKSLSGEYKKRSVFCNPCNSRGVVMMCGDGVNDAPALAAADIGVAMGAGAALAMETADVTLLDSNLEKLEFSIRMGRRVIHKIQENVVFSLAVKFVVLGFALAGRTSLWAAIASDVGTMILVTLNAMLLLPPRQRKDDVAMLKGDVEQANKARTTVGRDSDTESDEDALAASKLTAVSGCCSNGVCHARSEVPIGKSDDACGKPKGACCSHKEDAEAPASLEHKEPDPCSASSHNHSE